MVVGGGEEGGIEGGGRRGLDDGGQGWVRERQCEGKGVGVVCQVFLGHGEGASTITLTGPLKFRGVKKVTECFIFTIKFQFRSEDLQILVVHEDHRN